MATKAELQAELDKLRGLTSRQDVWVGITDAIAEGLPEHWLNDDAKENKWNVLADTIASAIVYYGLTTKVKARLRP